MFESLVPTAELLTIENFIHNLQKCRKLKATGQTKFLYKQACCLGLDSYAEVGNFLAQMFAECGCINEAGRVLIKIPYQTEHSWTALILGYVDYGPPQMSFNLYEMMVQKGFQPTVYTFMALLKACAKLRDIERGKEIHIRIMEITAGKDLYANNALIDMYAKCGLVSKAREIFDQLFVKDVVSWTSLIAGYADHGPGEEALRCFKQMQADGIAPNDVTLVCALKACASVKAIDEGREIGSKVIRTRILNNEFLGNSLLDMYAKCGALAEAREVFDKLFIRNTVSWNILIQGYVESGAVSEAMKCFKRMQNDGVLPDAMSWTSLIAGYAEHGPGHEALGLFEKMQMEGIISDAVTFASVLKACGNTGSIKKGQEVHAEVICKDYDSDLYIINSLIDMYGKCGMIPEAEQVFNKSPVRDICVWNSMINAYALNHNDTQAIRCFEQMKDHGIQPDSITFTCLLTACSHARMVKEAQGYFKRMIEDYNIRPNVGHYTCIIDLLARSGHVFEAERFLMETVSQSLYDEGMWASLLNACKIYGDVGVGLRCFNELVELNPAAAPPYVLMSDIYANAGRLDDDRRRKTTCNCYSRGEEEILGGDTPTDGLPG